MLSEIVLHHQSLTRGTTFQAKNDRLSKAARTGRKALDVNVRVETKATKLLLDLELPSFSRHSLSSS